MLKDTRMTSLLILHQVANEKGVTRKKIQAMVLWYYIYSFALLVTFLPGVFCSSKN